MLDKFVCGLSHDKAAINLNVPKKDKKIEIYNEFSLSRLATRKK